MEGGRLRAPVGGLKSKAAQGVPLQREIGFAIRSARILFCLRVALSEAPAPHRPLSTHCVLTPGAPFSPSLPPSFSHPFFDSCFSSPLYFRF